MPTSRRSFRTRESIATELITRAIVPVFLRTLGFGLIREVREEHGSAISQTISARAPSGTELVLRVRLCWRRRQGKGDNYSAAQLMARVASGDWERDIRQKVERQRQEGVTHLLLVQPAGDGIESAALIPLDGVLPIWKAQRDSSADLIARNLLGKRTSNHAMNGQSPTIYLRDDRHHDAAAVAEALWSYDGVIDLVKANATGLGTRSGRYGDAESNALVEAAAIAYVTHQYTQDGWAVRSVESEKVGYDLVCTRQTKTKHVEVKGRSTNEQRVVLTAREFTRARDDSSFVVAIVLSALSEKPQLVEYHASRFLALFEITPTQYTAELRRQ